tara:strand:+ start:1586 stop:2020 length:435 start_codon:yes stop_codon:yes gene_type:complete
MAVNKRYPNPNRTHLGSNPSGNVLRRTSGNQEFISNPRKKPKKKIILPHQTLSNTPWNKDPYKTAKNRLHKKSTFDKDVDLRYDSKLGHAGEFPVGVHKFSAFRNPEIHNVMRGHDDRNVLKTKRSMASKQAENSRLILDRPYQ